MSNAFQETQESLDSLRNNFKKLDGVGRTQFIGYLLGPIICSVAIVGYFGWWGALYDLGCFIWWYGWIGVKKDEV